MKIKILISAMLTLFLITPAWAGDEDVQVTDLSTLATGKTTYYLMVHDGSDVKKIKVSDLFPSGTISGTTLEWESGTSMPLLAGLIQYVNYLKSGAHTSSIFRNSIKKYSD